MSNHIADASKMVDTPRTDAKRSGENHFMGDWVDANFARQLERELNAANAKIKRLEEAGDRMRLYCADPDDCFAWDKARKDNP